MTEIDTFQCDYLDGHQARIHQVSVTFLADTSELLIKDPNDGQEILRWAFDDIRRIADQARDDHAIIHSTQSQTERLIIKDLSAYRKIRRQCPRLTKRSPFQNKGRLWRMALAAVASVGFIIFVLVPFMANQLAVFIPIKGERALGEATLENIRTSLDRTGFAPIPFCDTPEGMNALAKMTSRIMENTDLPVDISVQVLDHDMVNAFALPGGYVVFFRGLIEAAETPEEVAAVLGHEIGHVAMRHPTSGALRSAGSIGILGLLFGDFAGGAVALLLANQLIDASYSQTAEANADAYAFDRLRNAGVPPSALGRFFERLRDRYGEETGLVSHFMAHPSLTDRITSADTAVPATALGDPVLRDTEWRALQKICD